MPLPTATPAASAAERRAALLFGSVLAAWVAQRVATVWPFSTDDAYITLRYARHWASGQGLLWNVGEAPVEGYSNFLSLTLATASLRLGIDPLLTLKSLGVLSLFVAGALLWRQARRWAGPLGALAAPAALSALTGTVWWSVSGLETTLYLALALLAITFFQAGWEPTWRQNGEPKRGPLIAAALCALLVALTRPEGLLIGGVLGLFALVTLRKANLQESADRRRLAALALFAAVVLVPFALYTAWRLSYYGRLFPNPVYCKVSGAFSDGTLLRDYLGAAWPLLVAALPALAPRRFDPRLLPYLMIAALYGLLLRNADPVIAYHHRHTLLALALLAVVAAAGLASLSRVASARSSLDRRLLDAAAGVGVFLIAVFAARPIAELEADTDRYVDRMRARSEVAAFLDTHLPPDEVYATPDAGLIPYRTPHPVIDAMCLNCREATEPPISLDPYRYGAWLVARNPRFLVSVVDDRHRVRTGWAIGALSLTPQFPLAYREVAFFETTTPNLHFAVFERRPDWPPAKEGS